MSRFDAVIAAAREVGDMAHARWRGEGAAFKVWDKTPGHPVCDIDLAADKSLQTFLAKIDPEAGWLSEETADDPVRLKHARIWCVDPIDGTRDFIRGRSGWAVSIALIDGGEPVFGVLYAPARGETWVAERGLGATLNGEPIHVSDRSELPGARVPANELPKEDRDLVTVTQPNSIALRMAMVAASDADLVATLRWGHEWDIAAAALIVSEAGGAVTDAFGKPLKFNTPSAQAFGVLATAPGIHGAAVERLSERAAVIAPK